MSEPATLSAGDWYQIPGRGWVASFFCIPGFDPCPLSGQEVVIDGETYRVLGVETFAMPHVTGTSFGLLVGDRR